MNDLSIQVNIAKYISILVSEDLVFKIIQSGFSYPTMYHCIKETPYDDGCVYKLLGIVDLSEFTGLSTGTLLGLLKETKK